MRKYKYILFDADNTLFDFDMCEKEAFKNALNASGFQLAYINPQSATIVKEIVVDEQEDT